MQLTHNHKVEYKDSLQSKASTSTIFKLKNGWFAPFCPIFWWEGGEWHSLSMRRKKERSVVMVSLQDRESPPGTVVDSKGCFPFFRPSTGTMVCYTTNRFSSLISSSTFSGFAMCPSMPAFRDFSLSSSKALAEKARIFSLSPPGSFLMMDVASYPAKPQFVK